jgi:hypothetical protein
MTATDIHDEIPQGLYLQPLPSRLAPTAADRDDVEPDPLLPRTGDAVVIARGHVIWLTANQNAAQVTASTSYLWAAPLTTEGSQQVRWNAASIGQVDPGCLIHSIEDTAAIQSAQALLIEHANTAEATTR